MDNNIEERIQKIEERNRRVEDDKAWETSWARRILIAGLTYLIIGVFLRFINIPKPWMNAIVPTLGFLISTLAISFFKTAWLKRVNKK